MRFDFFDVLLEPSFVWPFVFLHIGKTFVPDVFDIAGKGEFGIQLKCDFSEEAGRF